MNKKICANCWAFFFILFFCTSAVFSQDTLAPAAKSQPVRLSFEKESDVDNTIFGKEESIDSSLSSFHRSRGFLYDITLERNIFFPGNKIHYRDNVAEFSNDITLPYKFSDRTIRYYNLNKRFTEITYLIGGKKEQLLNLIYTQNLSKGWSAGIDFRRAGAEGFFQRQQFYQSSFDVFTRYKSQSERYHLYAYYLRNHMEQQENGGIRNFNPDENTVAQPTYLSSAENRQTDKEILVRQFINIGKKKSSDSTDTSREIISIGHSVSYGTKRQLYIDSPSDSFYLNNFYDTTSTTDSLWYQRWNNKIFLYGAGQLAAGRFAGFYAALGHEHFSFKNEPSQFESEGRINQRENIYIELSANHSFPKGILLEGSLWWVVAGDYKRKDNGADQGPEDMFSHITFSKLILKNKFKLFAEAEWDVRHPCISGTRKYTNHFIWYNDFGQVKMQNVKGGITTPDEKFLLTASYSKTEDMIYYDSTATPRQFDETINILKLKLQKNFTWKYWHLENIIEYRKADNQDIIHIPEFMAGHSLAFEKFFFKSALLGRIGVDVRYVSAYYADRYMPALQEFYLQHTQETAGYVLADFFITFKVRSARFFARMENVLHGIYSEPEFSRPDYPLTSRYVRFGLQMRFFD